MKNTTQPYIGRFAPSPSGPLHFGSIVAALASYLQAKSQQGQWLVRIEDIDPPRETPEATKTILQQLSALGLHWDGELRYQSQQVPRYQQFIDAALASNQAYYCNCTRKQIKAIGGYYLGHCRELQISADQAAVRLKTQQPITLFNDIRLGEVSIPEALAKEDFIIKRRDGLYAYNLAVVLDDIDQGITEIVRGSDLLLTTGRQISLYQQLGQCAPKYLHLPLVMGDNGQKLSKQNHAPAVLLENPQDTLLQALTFLGQPAPKAWLDLSCDQLLIEATRNWNIQNLPADA